MKPLYKALTIVAGTFRRRVLQQPSLDITRPATHRVRQALFNTLIHWPNFSVTGAIVLDAFAGSGALGLEALSQGAQQAIFIEQDIAAFKILHHNIRALGVEAQCTTYHQSALTPPPAHRPASLIFLDPPYGKALEIPSLQALDHTGWIDTQTLIVLRREKPAPLAFPASFVMKREKKYGRSFVQFLQKREPIENKEETPALISC